MSLYIKRNKKGGDDMEYFAAGFAVALVVGGIAVAVELCND